MADTAIQLKVAEANLRDTGRGGIARVDQHMCGRNEALTTPERLLASKASGKQWSRSCLPFQSLGAQHCPNRGHH
jgi:hypothetical protein